VIIPEGSRSGDGTLIGVEPGCTNFRESSKREVRRIHLPRRSVNKGQVEEGPEPLGKDPGPVAHPLRLANSSSRTRHTQRLRTIRQRPTNTRKRSNLNSHLINAPTTRTSLFLKAKNIYVTARHKLRHTPCTGQEKRTEDMRATSEKTPLLGCS
jgi:hypothetical protein